MNIVERFRQSSLLKDFARIFCVDFIVKFSGFLLLPVYLRLMTQEEYGLYTYCIAIISTFSLILNFGLYIPQSKLYQDMSDDEEKGKLLFTINAVLGILLFSILSIMFYSGLDFSVIKFLFKSPFDYQHYRNWIFLGILVTIYSFMLFNYFLTSQKLAHVQSYNLVRLLVINGIVLSAMWLTNGDSVLIRLKYSFLCEFIFLAIFGYYYLKSWKVKFEIDYARKSLFLAMPVFFSAILGLALNFSDKFFVEKYGTFRDLAVYNLSFSLASIIPIVYMTFQNIWLPRFFQEKNISVNKEKTFRAVKWIGIIFLVVSIFIVVGFKGLLILSVIQMKYEGALHILPLLLISQVLSTITGLFSNYVIYFERTYVTVLIGVPMAVFNIVSNWFFIPRYGLWGASFASFLTHASYLLAYSYWLRSTLNEIDSKREPAKACLDTPRSQ